MKKSHILILTACLLMVLFSTASSAQEPFARAIAVEGNAQWQKAGGADWQPMKDGMTLDSGDAIKTPAASRVDISYDKDLNNVLRVLEKSGVTLGQDKVQMSEGRVLAKLDDLKPGTEFNVRTPNAICGVRGSAFGVESEGDTTEAFAYENNTYVTALDNAGNALGDTLTVPQGMTSTVVLGSSPGVPALMSDSDMNEFKQFAEDIADLAGATMNQGAQVSPTISPSGAR